MDPHGPIARRFPLIARHRPACLPLPDRVHALVDLAHNAAAQHDPGLASTVFNQSALLASDIGLPDLARTLCHRHAQAYLNACPLPAMSAIRGLEPLVNLARLHIRASHPDDGRQRLLDLYQAVSAAESVTIDGITVPSSLTRTTEERQEVRAWLWRVLLADGTRTFTTTGRWHEALAHLERHRGVGTRMLDGRQVAVIAALIEDDTERASALIINTAPGDLWETEVTAVLTALALRESPRNSDASMTDLADEYLKREARPGTTVFDIRLGLAMLDVIASTGHPSSRCLVDALASRAAGARDGYAAHELLVDRVFTTLTVDRQVQELRELIKACALGSGTLPVGQRGDLESAADSAEAVLAPSLLSRPLPS